MTARLLPSPVAQWEEPPKAGTAGIAVRLTPYLLTDGSQVFLARTDAIPVGAVRDYVVDVVDGSVNFDSTVLVGLRVSQGGSGSVFFY